MKIAFVRTACRMLATVLLLFAGSCVIQGPTSTSSPVRYVYAGGQDGNEFQLWIWIFEDEKTPALVRSGLCRYIDNQFVDTDIENLNCRFTENGFTLSDPVTGEVLYTAVNLDESGFPAGYFVRLTWTHSPGSTWNALSEEKGWRREMTLEQQQMKVCDLVQ